VAFEDGSTVRPPAIKVEQKPLPPSRPRKAPGPVPKVTHPGVLMIVLGVLAVLAGAFGPWTSQLLLDRAVLAGDPWATVAFSVICLVCLAAYLRGMGEGWKNTIAAFTGMILAQSVITIVDIRQFPGDHPRLDADPVIGWGLWLTLAGGILVLIGLAYMHLRPQQPSHGLRQHRFRSGSRRGTTKGT